MRFVGIGAFASRSKSEAIVMSGDPEECRILASRCAEIAASAKTPQLKAWFSELSVKWEKIAIDLENGFAQFVENSDPIREHLWRPLDEANRLSRSLHPKERQSHPSRRSARSI
jgi:hypothetical protein